MLRCRVKNVELGFEETRQPMVLMHPVLRSLGGSIAYIFSYSLLTRSLTHKAGSFIFGLQLL